MKKLSEEIGRLQRIGKTHRRLRIEHIASELIAIRKIPGVGFIEVVEVIEELVHKSWNHAGVPLTHLNGNPLYNWPYCMEYAE